MKKNKLRIVQWTSDNKESEFHYYIGEKWICGYNPKFIKHEDIDKILREVKKLLI